LRSALYNLSVYHSFIPHGWATITIGDHYYWLAFRFLSYISRSLGVDEKELLAKEIAEEDATKIAAEFIDKLDFGDHAYMAKPLRSYFVRLLCSQPRHPSKELQQTKVACFLSHSVSDNEFCDRLYSDLIASGFACWYFPEDATFGKGMWHDIDDHIRSSDRVIVACSQNSLTSAPVLREIERALQREDMESRNILLPIRIDDYVLRHWNHPRKADVIAKVVGDFQHWRDEDSYHRSLRRLIDALQP